MIIYVTNDNTTLQNKWQNHFYINSIEGNIKQYFSNPTGHYIWFRDPARLRRYEEWIVLIIVEVIPRGVQKGAVGIISLLPSGYGCANRGTDGYHRLLGYHRLGPYSS